MTQIRKLTDEEVELMVASESMEQEEAVRQSRDRSLMLTELSEYDLSHMQEILKEGHGDWFHAKLLRALYDLLPDADSNNSRRLRTTFPGTCAALMAWYNGTLSQTTK